LLKLNAEIWLGCPVKCKNLRRFGPAVASSQIIPVPLGDVQLEFQSQILLENFPTSFL
jgi:hypothetical protein